jgi:hypothetical protein
LELRTDGRVEVRARFPTSVPFISPKSLGCVMPYGCTTDATRVEVEEMVEEIDG